MGLTSFFHRYRRFGWAWVGATFGGYAGTTVGQSLISGLLDASFITSSAVGPYVDAIPPDFVGFLLGAFLALLAGEAITGPSVARGIKGMILGTKHALAASTGGFLGLYVSRTVPMARITVVPELTVSSIGAAIGIVLGHVLLR